jgi:Pretoxin HINT domain/Novel toxin 21
MGEIGATIAILGVSSSLSWSASYIINSPDVYAEDVYGLYGQWGMGFAQGISGGIITDVYSNLTGETLKPTNDFMWQMGMMAGSSLLIGAGFVVGGSITTIGIGIEAWVGVTNLYGAGKGIIGLSDGKWEQNDVWNLLSLLPIAGPLLGSAAKGITAMRAAGRVGQEASVANTAGRNIDQVVQELTEVKTHVEPAGTPAPGTAPEPMPVGHDPVPTSPNAPTGCFIAGTDILTPDGEKDIETIQVGDYVMADDPNTPGDVQARRVVQTYIREVMTVIDLYIDGELITTTEEHPFWVPELGWVKARDLQVGTLVQTDHETFLDVDKVVRREGTFTVYNFQVEDFHSYFVSDLGILVHNNNCNKASEPPSPALEGNAWSPEEVAKRRAAAQEYYGNLFDPRAAANDLGYPTRIPPQKAPFDSHGQPVFSNGKNFITPDVDGHNVTNGWKMFNRRGDRIGAYSTDLQYIKP